MRRTRHRSLPFLVLAALLGSGFAPGGPLASARATVPAGGWIPRDPGTSGRPGGWQAVQWNFAGRFGVDAPRAWANLQRAGHPGGRGATVAVLDTGVAYRDHGHFRRSPDFGSREFARGYDFVDGDRQPDDENGHGTHVAGTIGERTGNAIGVTGLAYGVKLMPIRVLDATGAGDLAPIAAGIRYAARHGADVLNLSFDFPTSTARVQLRPMLAALRYAHRRGALVVASAGNAGAAAVGYPARAPHVLAVGASTEHGCVAVYSNRGAGLDIVAPGGGTDDRTPGDRRCDSGRAGRNIVQMTFGGARRAFGLPRDWAGTSMAAPHVSAAAALVIASGVLGPHPAPDAVAARLEATARPLGPAGTYGAGLIDAAAATDPGDLRR